MPKRSLKRRLHRWAVALARAASVSTAAASRLHTTIRASPRLIRLWSYLLDVLLDVPKHAIAIVLIAMASQWWRLLQGSMPA